MEKTDVVVVGAGIVGLASAWKLSIAYPDLKVVVLEKEAAVASHQTGHNSGVIHSGIYYKPGSYKARNCVDGRRELVSFAKEHKIPHDICGKVIVATDPSELNHLEKVFRNGTENGVESMRFINPDEIRELEPHCVGIRGIHVGCTGIIDYADVARTYERLINERGNGSKVLCNTLVKGFTRGEEQTIVHTSKGDIVSRYVVACAGLQSDRIAKKDDAASDAAIVGFRGDYYELSDKGMEKVRNLIYPVPNPKFPFLGVHFTRMIHGGVECGPNAVFVFKREGYGKTDFSMRDTIDAFSFGGTWKFFYKHWRFGLDEYRGAFSKHYFLKRLRKLIPGLQLDDLKPGRAGVRAMALAPEGEMIDDFKFETRGNSIHVLNAPSPAATSSLAVGAEVARVAAEQFRLR